MARDIESCLVIRASDIDEQLIYISELLERWKHVSPELLCSLINNKELNPYTLVTHHGNIGDVANFIHAKLPVSIIHEDEKLSDEYDYPYKFSIWDSDEDYLYQDIGHNPEILYTYFIKDEVDKLEKKHPEYAGKTTEAALNRFLGSKKDKSRIEKTKEACDSIMNDLTEIITRQEFFERVRGFMGECKPHVDTLEEAWRSVPKEHKNKGRPKDTASI